MLLFYLSYMYDIPHQTIGEYTGENGRCIYNICSQDVMLGESDSVGYIQIFQDQDQLR